MVATTVLTAAIIGDDAECRLNSVHMSLTEHEYVGAQRGLLNKFHPFESTRDVENFYIAFVIAFHSILLFLFVIEMLFLLFSMCRMVDPVRSLHRWNVSRWHWNAVHESWAGGILATIALLFILILVSWQNGKIISHINDHSPFSLSAVFYSVLTWLVLGAARVVGSYKGLPTDMIMLVHPMCLIILSRWYSWQVTAWDVWGPSAVKTNQATAASLFLVAGVWKLIIGRQLYISAGTSLYVRVPMRFRLGLCKLAIASRIIELLITTIACGLLLTPVPDNRIPNWFRCADYLLDDYIGFTITTFLVWSLLFLLLAIAGSLNWFSVFAFITSPTDAVVKRINEDQTRDNPPLTVPPSRFVYLEVSPYTLYDPASVMHLSAVWSTRPTITTKQETIETTTAEQLITPVNNANSASKKQDTEPILPLL